MIIGLIIFFIILGFIVGSLTWHTKIGSGGFLISWLLAFIIFIFGCFHGFINHKATEGVHQGVITAVDLEGTYFRRYKVYLKSSGYTTQSDETIYLLYDYETELAEELIDLVGQEVKLYYGFDGGYIAWNSCGTYHIVDVELVEE